MGAVDLVIQVESPKSVTRGLQRVGRAGHALGEVSKGRIFPKFRADLLECAVVAKRMRDGEIEETVIPRNPLDVLAQHIVVDGRRRASGSSTTIEKLVTATESFRELSREQLENVLDMLDGRYPSERFAELRPRIVWDRTAGIGPRPQGRPPARCHQRRHDPRPRPLRRPPSRRPPGRRARRGDGLRGPPGPDLPARRDDLADRGHHPRPGDRHPAPGCPARCRSGAATASGARPSSAGRSARSPARRSKPTRDAGAPRTTSTAAPPRTSSPTCASSRPRPASSPPTSRSWSSASATRSATGACACSRRSAAASTPPGACALAARIRDEHDLEADAIWSDDGIVVHLPDADEAPGRRHGPARARRGRGPGRRRARRLGPVRRPLPRERRPQPADPARLSGQAHAAVAAAPEVAEPARGGPRLPPLPGDPRDLPRVPARRARPAGAHRPAARPAVAQDLPGRGRDADGLAVRLLAALRLRRDLHVRGRHAQRRAPRRGAGARPRPALASCSAPRSCAS